MNFDGCGGDTACQEERLNRHRCANGVDLGAVAGGCDRYNNPDSESGQIPARPEDGDEEEDDEEQEKHYEDGTRWCDPQEDEDGDPVMGCRDICETDVYPGTDGCVEVVRCDDDPRAADHCIDEEETTESRTTTKEGLDCLAFGDAFLDGFYLYPAVFAYDHDDDASTPEICSHSEPLANPAPPRPPPPPPQPRPPVLVAECAPVAGGDEWQPTVRWAGVAGRDFRNYRVITDADFEAGLAETAVAGLGAIMVNNSFFIIWWPAPVAAGEHEFRAKARVRGVWSDWGAATADCTPDPPDPGEPDPPDPPAPEEPAPPAGLDAGLRVECVWDGASDKDAQVRVQWDAVATDSYVVEYRDRPSPYAVSATQQRSFAAPVQDGGLPVVFTPSREDVIAEARLTAQRAGEAVGTTDWEQGWCGAPMYDITLRCAAERTAGGDTLTSASLEVGYSLRDGLHPAVLEHRVQLSFQVQILDWGAEAAAWSAQQSDTHHVLGGQDRHLGEWEPPPGAAAQRIDPALANAYLPLPQVFETPQHQAGTSAEGTITIPHRMAGFTYRIHARTTYWLPFASAEDGHRTHAYEQLTATCDTPDCGNDRQHWWANHLFNPNTPAHYTGQQGDTPPQVPSEAENQNGDPNCCAEPADWPIGIGQNGCHLRCHNEITPSTRWTPRQLCNRP